MSTKRSSGKVEFLPAPTSTPAPKPAHARNRLRLKNVAIGAIVLGCFYLFAPIARRRAHGHVSVVEGSWTIFKTEPVLTGKVAEDLFLTIPNEKSALKASREYAEKPHMAGSANDYVSAIVQLQLFQDKFNITPPSDLPVFEAGSPGSRNAILDIGSLTGPSAWIDTYYPLLNTPLERKLEVVRNGKVAWSASLEEKDYDEDDAGKYAHTIPAWHGFSKEGDVTGKLIYVKYGRKSEFDELAAAGVDFTGTIAIVRYGAVFRGLKVKAAQEAGCVGIIIYSDPRDDGYVTEENGHKVYPHGPARNPHTVQRGSVEFLSMYPGDPTTPGLPAYENATRAEPLNIPSIPSLPISWANAKHLLAEIGNAYENGEKSANDIRLLNTVDQKVKPIWNTMAVIPGQIKDEVVVIGNHRDAWVIGAGDPTSGTVSLHEIVRGFGELLKQGWQPMRTIVIASWDGEEYGLIGSTEWGEDFADWIKQNVVAYLNIDSATSGSRFNLVASPSLSRLLRTAAQEIPHPTDANRTLWDARTDVGPFTPPADPEPQPEPAPEPEPEAQDGEGDLPIGPLGSGSDYTVFLQRLGIASTDQGFGGTTSDAVYHYHSVYDSQRWQELYADPGFHRHVAIAKHLGLVALRLADSIILPLDTTQYSNELDGYLTKVESISSDVGFRAEFTDLRKAITRLKSASAKLDSKKAKTEKAFLKELEKWRRERSKSPGDSKGKKLVCAGRQRQIKGVEKWVKDVFGVVGPSGSASRGQGGVSVRAHGLANARGPASPPSKRFLKALRRVQDVNKKLSTFEQGFISEEGIKDREWYKHLGVAPGKWLGYGATTFPALTEAIEIEKNATLADFEAARLQQLITKLSSALNH
ncbi:hypothetical protein BOTBODRAFT_29986 [Botryobasidium botryosum FD-172 SS1]|uniref:Zn-dependent exopeptidase n=1 Tax=Botryobasidium botryosum (strain FD-172 SS1) TaxID=930990 RepID=A0A067MZ39_BOTB1|nr:hypothetical protein BOTBODRAFT_29986 [Botryobasidium botryosum FD-172 SS1]